MKFISYIRKSPSNHLTTQEGLDSNSIGAQRAAIERHLQGVPVIREFVEYESARQHKHRRPELTKALALCKQEGAKLIISRLDRLLRSVSFLCQLRDSEVQFVALDALNMDAMTLTIIAAVSEKELENLSARTRAGMAIAKARGAKIGNPRISEAQRLGRETVAAKARTFAQEMHPIIKDIQSTFARASLRDISSCLNRRGYVGANGKRFYPQTVKNLLQLVSQ